MLKQKLFISYSRLDSEIAVKLVTQLRGKGINIWLDQLDIPPGAIWDVETEKALEECDCLLFIVSKASVASTNVLNEVYFALEEKKKVLPVKINDCRIPFRIKRLQFVDLSINYDQGFGSLLKALMPETGHPPTEEDELIDKSSSDIEMKENELWQQAENVNSKEAYEKYLEQYPAGKYRNQAFSNIRFLDLEREKQLQQAAVANKRSDEEKKWNDEKASITVKRTMYQDVAGFIVSVIVVFLFVYFSKLLVGSKSAVYFLILIALGICSAIFLFKGLKSYAAYTRKTLTHYFRLSAAFVLFSLLIASGYWLYQHPQSLYEDPKITLQRKQLSARISTTLNSYLNDAKDFRDLISDSSTVFNDSDSAFNALVETINRYNRSYLLLNTIKDSLNSTNKSLLAVDIADLEKIIKSFGYVHRELFLTFNNTVRPDLMKYLSTDKPTIQDKNKIDHNIHESIIKTKEDMTTLETLIPQIQKQLKY